MGEKEIKQELREAFGLDENLAEIKKYNDETMGDLGLNSLLSDDKVYWIIKCNSSCQADKLEITKFDLNKLNELNKSIILHGWTFECEIEAKKKRFKFPIVFSACRVHMPKQESSDQALGQEASNQSTPHFSLSGYHFEEDVIFRGIGTEVGSVQISIIDCKFAKKIRLDSVILDTLTLSGVEFGGEVSFDSMRIENFEMKGNENPIKDSALKSRCHFSNIQIEKANFLNTQFGGETQFDGVKFNQSVS